MEESSLLKSERYKKHHFKNSIWFKPLSKKYYLYNIKSIYKAKVSFKLFPLNISQPTDL